MKLIFILFISAYALMGVTLKELNSYPTSLGKDFYIWVYLKQSNITSKQADEAFYQIKNVTPKMLYVYAKKSDDKDLKEVVRCERLNHTKISKYESTTCIANAYTPYKATKIPLKKRQELINYLNNDYPDIAYELKILSIDNPIETLIKDEKPEIFLSLYNNSGGDYRKGHFNHYLPKDFLLSLINLDDFDTFILKAVTNRHANNITKSLLQLYQYPQKFSHKTNFFLALNALNFKDNKQTNYYLEQAYKSAYYQQDKDKVLFWQYLVSNDKKYLKQLNDSWDLNIYSLLAKEKLNLSYPKVPTTYSLNNKPSGYNLQNPFEWRELLIKFKNKSKSELKNLSKQFLNKNDIAVYAYLDERLSGYRTIPYISPYNEYLDNYSDKMKVLINSIARQESRFIPGAVSTAFAMGVMQIMPFLSKAIAKQKKEHYYILDMFEAEKSVRYGAYHLTKLKKNLQNNPLFIAYAYNAGEGFLRGRLRDGFFSSKSKYEPFLSMELIPYDETRRYGKKVLANYAMYSKIYKNNFSLNSFFKNL